MRTTMKSLRVYTEELGEFVLAYVPRSERIFLIPAKLRDHIPSSVLVSETELKWDEKPVAEDQQTTDLVLLLTTACNLQCVYCYSSAGPATHVMTGDLASKSIQHVAQSAKLAGRRSFSVLFHGEGEPTANWQVLQSAVSAAKSTAEGLDLEVKFSLATNGAYGFEKREYLGREMDNITVSFDGPRDLFEKQRPQASGASVFDQVLETAHYFYARRDRLKFGLRATLLPDSLQRLPEIVRFLARELPGVQFSVEPVDYLGRYSGKERRQFSGFAPAYRAAKKVADAAGMRFWYSAARGPRRSDYFCGVGGRTMVVGPSGLVSGCSRCSRKGHVGDDVFLFGEFRPDQEQPLIRKDKLAVLQSFRGENMSECLDCIAFAWCRGDCRHIRYSGNGSVLAGVSPMCHEIRSIVVGELLDRALPEREANELFAGYYDRQSEALSVPGRLPLPLLPVVSPIAY